jgi:hypothetical protein
MQKGSNLASSKNLSETGAPHHNFTSESWVENSTNMTECTQDIQSINSDKKNLPQSPFTGKFF